MGSLVESSAGCSRTRHFLRNRVLSRELRRCDGRRRGLSSANADVPRSGLTMIEAVLATSLVALLLSLIVPAVVAVRESSRRVECANRLRQFGVALHSFESSHQCLPALGIRGSSQAGSTYSPQARLLPYLGESAAWDELQKLNADIVAAPGVINLQTSLTCFVCPADAVPRTISYRMCTGSVPAVYVAAAIDSVDPLRHPVGPFAGFPNDSDNGRGLRIQAIKDGISQTAAMCERLASDQTPGTFNRDRDVWYSGVQLLNPEVAYDADQMWNACAAFSGDPGYWYAMYMGWFPAVAGLENTGYNHVLTPSSPVTDCAGSRVRLPQEGKPYYMAMPTAAVSARSNHAGGIVNLLLLDGSVTPVSADIDVQVWRRLGTINDSELLR